MDALVLAKCGGTCHIRDERGNLPHISWSRTTPEGWQNVLRRMIIERGVSVTPAEARTIVKDLSANHGLAPGEAASVRYSQERRIYAETNIPNEEIREACAKCHAFAVALSWRRSSGEWQEFLLAHAVRQKFPPNPQAAEFLVKAAPLSTPEWEAWRTRGQADLEGRWLVTASIPGRGKYWGDMQVDRAESGDFATRTSLTAVADGAVVARTGRSVVYGDTAWRGRSAGLGAAGGGQPDDPFNEAREVLVVAATHTRAEGRWFWGQYQEFGFDVHLQRPAAEPALLAVDRASLKTGSRGNRLRLLGDNFPATVSAADLAFGPGMTVRSVLLSTAKEVVVEVDVAVDAPLGMRSVAFRATVLPGALAVYDRVDYVKVVPESSVAAFSDATHPKGYLQYEAIGYQRGPDGRMRTADDVELGPIEVTWSLDVFHAPAGSDAERVVGKVTAGGLFMPSSDSPRSSFDVWVSAAAKTERDRNGKPLVGKSYLVVTPPTYVFNGRRYVRDLDHWVDDGPATGREGN